MADWLRYLFAVLAVPALVLLVAVLMIGAVLAAEEALDPHDEPEEP